MHNPKIVGNAVPAVLTVSIMRRKRSWLIRWIVWPSHHCSVCPTLMFL